MNKKEEIFFNITCLNFFETSLPTNVKSEISSVNQIHDEIEILSVLESEFHIHKESIVEFEACVTSLNNFLSSKKGRYGCES